MKLKHFIIYLVCYVAVYFILDSMKKPEVDRPAQPMGSTRSIGIDRSDDAITTGNTSNQNSVPEIQGAAPKNSVAYQRGYKKGYKAGQYDCEMHLGYYAEYDDRNNYSGKKWHEYREGYEDGYNDGYDDYISDTGMDEDDEY